MRAQLGSHVSGNHENMKIGIGDFYLFFLSLSLSLSFSFLLHALIPLVVFSCFRDFLKRGHGHPMRVCRSSPTRLRKS